MLHNLSSDSYSHWSTHIAVPLLHFLPVSGRADGCLIPITVFSDRGKVKRSYALSEISYLYDLEEARKFGISNRILRGAGTAL
jgi:hypothetical protein